MIVFILNGVCYYWYMQTSEAYEDIEFLVFMARALDGHAYTA